MEASLLWLMPLSGRRHQLRVHCAHNGHPIVGDLTYAGDRLAYRTFLHASALELPLATPGGGGGIGDGSIGSIGSIGDGSIRYCSPLQPRAWGDAFEPLEPLRRPEEWSAAVDQVYGALTCDLT